MLTSPLTAEKAASLLNDDQCTDIPQYNQTIRVGKILEKLTDGGNFWDDVWRPFISRDLDREAVKTVLKKFYGQSSNSFKKMLPLLHLPEKDYRKFMSLVYKYKIDPRK